MNAASGEWRIGEAFRGRRRAAAVLAAVAVAFDYALVVLNVFVEVRTCAAMTAFAATIVLADFETYFTPLIDRLWRPRVFGRKKFTFTQADAA